MHQMVELGLTVEEVDAVSGPATARPKSACFRTADLVGIDTLAHVARNSYELLPGDERRETFKLPAFVDEMVAKGLLGNKAKAGLLQEDQGAEAGDRLPRRQDRRVRAARSGRASPRWRRPRPSTTRRRASRRCWLGKDPAAQFAWRNLRDTLLYAFARIPEIADDVVEVDRAMRWGFSWELGPFEMLDAIGVQAFVARAEADGVAVPAALRRWSGFYGFEDGRRRYLDLAIGRHEATWWSRPARWTSPCSGGPGPRWSGAAAPRCSISATGSSAWSSTPR